MDDAHPDALQYKLRKRRVSWDRAEKARQALAPYLEAVAAEGNDLRFALTDFLTDVRHLADREGVDMDEETLTAILERSALFFREEECVQFLGKAFAPKE